ncbi:ATP-binding cassette domain-containing protein [Phycicoccus sp. CSK15P-2]|uniref:ATP-binding cassette domain-containing protein n=1 Tax=Phycicoccus sp. CSK15P-2 TaxID=2807627 RepID=UPI0019513D06|nr:ATP-binding cassette domain-containing protein [Phycicoccus sp. CSK15P-2]MBM6402950.1 ATP-binding cassette domain-containing protein [Phycicoccus sp. CSK15P-2]
MGEAEATPSVVVSHVDIVYRVFAGRRPGSRGPRSWLSRDEENRSVRTVHAVKDVSFVARHGESIGIIGRNGSGKSTLLRAVAGLMPPTNGHVWSDGTPSLLGVNAVLVKQLSGARNIYIGAQALGLSREEVDDVYADIVEFSGIGDAIDLPMSAYSSGMAARLRFAISTAAVPPVLVVDEALATGDADFRARSRERIEGLRERAGTVFLVSHSAASIRSMCDRAIWLDSGELVADGPVDLVLEAYQSSSKRPPRSHPPAEPDVPGVERWSGDTRYHTSALTSRRGLQDQTDTVVLASGADLALALACVPGGASVAAPVLLTHPTRLMRTTRAEIERLGPQQVVLAGGPGIIGAEVAEAVDALGVVVHRLGGDDSVATSRVMLTDLTEVTTLDVVYLAPVGESGAVLTAAISSEPGTSRVLLVGEDGLTAETEAALEQLSVRVIRVLADDDTLDGAALERLRSLAREGVQRVLTPTAAAAAAAVSQDSHGRGVDVVYVASADDTAVGDAVTGAGVAEMAGAPFLLVERDDVPQVTHEELERLAPSHIVLLGGPATITPAVRARLADYLVSDADDAGPAPAL